MITQRKQRSFAAVPLLAMLGLAACTAINYADKPPADFPKLAVYEHPLKFGDFWSKCYPQVSLAFKLIGSLPSACMVGNFATRRCDIYYPVDARDDEVMRHEYAHCRGYDHYGSSDIAHAWTTYKAAHFIR